jgi:L-serine dehydratase
MKARRIRVNGFTDIPRLMPRLNIATLPDFFILYESLNKSIPSDEIIAKMERVLTALEESVADALSQPNKTESGMIAGGASLLQQYSAAGGSLLGSAFSQVICNAMAVAEHNACMGRIVAAPTAGSCGVLPGALLTVAKLHKIPRERVLRSLFVAGGIGEIISIRASLSGSTHGCQAENGSASAMSAAAIAALFVDDLSTIESAAAFGLKNLLGLTCDPVGGLVELPCVKRNVVAAVNAVACAEMALAGIKTVIPLDEVIDAMAAIGNSIPSTLRETSQGGLAVTETAQRITAAMRGKQ